VVQRAWLEVLVKALLAQGAHAVSAVPAQLCLPFQPGAVSAALRRAMPVSTWCCASRNSKAWA
jgi:hypothetical protein